MKKKKRVRAYVFGPFLWAWNSNANGDAVIAVYDEKYIQTVISGPKGLSPELKVRQLECSICRQDYEECEHLQGKTYSNKTCECLISKFEAINITSVSKPEDPRSKITDMLVLKNNKSYTWYGFETNNDNERFSHMQKAKDNGYISEKVALYFSTYFTQHYTGVISYPT